MVGFGSGMARRSIRFPYVFPSFTRCFLNQKVGAEVIKKVIKGLTPYGVVRLVEKLQEPPPPPPSTLFDGDDALFKSILVNTQLYGEFGCGASTKWVLSNTNAEVLAVDTSKHWIEEVTMALDAESERRARFLHVDLGELGDWGRPKSYEKTSHFPMYTDWLWNQPRKPDTVLIDGRFRVCSFLTSLKYADEGTNIIFDDYTDRPHYHVVEKFLPRESACGRQCLFKVPSRSQIDFEDLESEIRNFRYVMD